MSTAMPESVNLPIIDPHRPDREQAAFFKARAAGIAFDQRHRRVLRAVSAHFQTSVARGKERFLDIQDARRRAAAIKREVVANLPKYLQQFEENVQKNGGHVHWAETAQQAREIIVGIARQAGVKHVVKGKSMASEEIHLNEAFSEAGIEPVETDLGEYICQLRDEPPYHIVAPALQLTRGDVGQTFHEKLGIELTDVPEELTTVCRERLRQKFVAAKMGTSGGNFLVADAGMVALTENEGNIRLSFSMPEIHVALVGIEKIVPRLQDLALFWPMLSTHGTGQHISCYNSLVGGPRRPGEHDGPKEFHVVLLDNGRTRLLADPELREALQCIRCGCCLTVCPIYKSVGGHSYGTTYSGPIGAVITPNLKNLAHWKHLSYSSSLCGHCAEVCPVKIDLHHHLLRNRRNSVRQGMSSWSERLLFRGWLWGMRSAARFSLLGRCAKVGDWFFRALGLDRRTFGNPVAGWTKTRTLPRLAKQSFRDWWRQEGGQS